MWTGTSSRKKAIIGRRGENISAAELQRVIDARMRGEKGDAFHLRQVRLLVGLVLRRRLTTAAISQSSKSALSLLTRRLQQDPKYHPVGDQQQRHIKCRNKIGRAKVRRLELASAHAASAVIEGK